MVSEFRVDKVYKTKTTLPGGLDNTGFACVMNEGTWRKIAKADQDGIGKLAGEHAARLFGRGWDTVDRRANAFMQTAGVVNTVAGKPFVDEIRGKTLPREQKWIADAKAKGPPNPEQVLKEFRAEIAKK